MKITACPGAFFVYGREVKDFRTVDYGAVTVLNVSATQKIYRLLEKKDAEITTLNNVLHGKTRRFRSA
jgi:hypothetical protein